jgi:hypothetical protein
MQRLLKLASIVCFALGVSTLGGCAVYAEPVRPVVIARPAYVWIPGHWVRAPGRWIWVEGHWHR